AEFRVADAERVRIVISSRGHHRNWRRVNHFDALVVSVYIRRRSWEKSAAAAAWWAEHPSGSGRPPGRRRLRAAAWPGGRDQARRLPPGSKHAFLLGGICTTIS